MLIAAKKCRILRAAGFHFRFFGETRSSTLQDMWEQEKAADYAQTISSSGLATRDVLTPLLSKLVQHAQLCLTADQQKECPIHKNI